MDRYKNDVIIVVPSYENKRQRNIEVFDNGKYLFGKNRQSANDSNLILFGSHFTNLHLD